MVRPPLSPDRPSRSCCVPTPSSPIGQIVSVRLPKPVIPAAIRADYQEVERVRTQLALVSAQQSTRRRVCVCVYDVLRGVVRVHRLVGTPVSAFGATVCVVVTRIVELVTIAFFCVCVCDALVCVCAMRACVCAMRVCVCVCVCVCLCVCQTTSCGWRRLHGVRR